MAISVNRITLVGNAGSDPEQSGSGPVKFSLATSKRWKDRGGEPQEKTTWHKIVIWNEHAQKFALQFVKKGDLVYIEGEMEHRVWEKDDGEKVNLAEVVVQPYTGVIQAVSRVKGTDEQDRQEPSSRQSRSEPKSDQSGSRYSGSADLDDEIPFAPEWR